MVDFRVHDSLIAHPKMLGIHPAALGLWTYAGAWSSHYLTDGLVPTEAIRHIPGWQRHAAELVDRHLWAPVNGGGWTFIDWGQYQRTRTEVETQRDLNRARAQRARDRRRHA